MIASYEDPDEARITRIKYRGTVVQYARAHALEYTQRIYQQRSKGKSKGKGKWEGGVYYVSHAHSP